MTTPISIVSLLFLVGLIPQDAWAADASLPLGSTADEIAITVVLDGVERLDTANTLDQSHIRIFTRGVIGKNLLAEFYRYYFPDRQSFEALCDKVVTARACLPEEQGVFRIDRLDWFGLNPEDLLRTRWRFMHPSDTVDQYQKSDPSQLLIPDQIDPVRQGGYKPHQLRRPPGRAWND